MYIAKTTKSVLVGGLVLASLALLPASAAADERGDKILANLKLQFPQLAQLNLTMGDIAASEYSGLDQGSFTMASPQGNRTQNFLVSKDDTKLFLISGDPIDVSKSKSEIDAAVAEREAEAAEAARDRRAELDSAVEGLPARGNPNAKITIVEFSDFQCPFCARGADTMEQILEKYDDVKFVFKHFPLNFHPWAKPAAIAAHCAGEQNGDAFWKLHDKYFEDQKALNPDNVLAKSKEYLAGSGIDIDSWSDCAENKESEAYKAASAAVDADMALGSRHGVSGTPGFFVNGRFLNGAQPLSAFEPLLEQARADGP